MVLKSQRGERTPAKSEPDAKFVLEVEDLCHTRESAGDLSRFVLAVRSFNLLPGSFTSVLGSSGCGKTTMLTVLALALAPRCCHPAHEPVRKFIIREMFSGRTEYDIVTLRRRSSRGERRIERLRRKHLGFCLQEGELLPTLSVRQNVEMPLRLNNWPRRRIAERIRVVLDHLLQDDRKSLEHRRACDLSRGQYQRVALARAIIHQPAIAFIDEPTGNLDQRNARHALDLVSRCAADDQSTIVMITHDEELAKDYSECIVRMHSPKDAWDDGIPFPRRPNDGWGTIARFERRVKKVSPGCNQFKATWIETNARWQPLRTTDLPATA